VTSPETRPTSPAAQTVVQVKPVEDTYVNAGAPSRAFGSTSSLSSRGTITAVTYLTYAVPAAPAGATLRSASLNVHTTMTSDAGSADTHRVSLVSGSWTESSLTWTNRSLVTGVMLGEVPAGTQPSHAYVVPLDVAQLQGRLGSQVTLSVSSSGLDSLWLWSRNYAVEALRPNLVLTYS
jgi:hypothetical protein